MTEHSVINKLRPFMMGREIELVDTAIFYINRKQYSQWFLSNRLYYYWIRKRKYISHLPFIVVCGFPRSGTTLLQMLIAACYKDIKGPYEESSPFELYVDRKKTASIFELSHSNVEEMWRKADHDIILFCELILKEYSRINNGSIVLLKRPQVLILLDKLFYHFPRVKVIHIIRDGRDAVLSAKEFLSKQFNEKYTFEWCARQWVAFIHSSKKYRHTKNYLEIKYENLVYHTHDTLCEISRFLEIDEPDLLLIHNYINNLNKGKIPATHKEQIGMGIYDTSIGRYVNEMNEKQRRYFKKIGGELLLSELGYDQF
ncbi:MAG: sulfotransferase [Candidatus Nitrosocaldus sp.]|nr:sulfotransferase [Candidatus Nitrosocaldus sp.]